MDKEIRESLDRYVNGLLPASDVICTVDSVNLTKLTCYCIPKNGGADYKDVRLMAQKSNGFLIIPKEGSDVVVSFLDGATGYVSMFSEVDEIQLNGDNYSGLVKVNDLVTKLNNLENKINSLLFVMGTTWVPVSNDGGAALKALMIPPLTNPLAVTVKENLENTTVLHGNGT